MSEHPDAPIPPDLPAAPATGRRRRSFWRSPAGAFAMLGLGVGALFLTAIVGFGLAMEIGAVPSDRVVPGAELRESVVAELRSAGVLREGEQVTYLYSDALFDWLEDGNLFTEDRVVSYWREDGELHIVGETFDRIDGIDVSWSSGLLENTEITVDCVDGSQFVLVVSAEGGLDRDFYDALNKRWRERR